MNSNTEALIADMKAAAEKATSGQWEMEHENIWFTDADGCTKHLAYFYQGNDVDDEQDNDNTKFFALANPANVQALIAALEQSQLERDNMQSSRDLHKKVNQGLSEQLIAANKRIAELEASQLAVKLPPKFNVRLGGDKVTRAMFSGHNGAIDDCAEVLRAAGITVQGDE